MPTVSELDAMIYTHQQSLAYHNEEIKRLTLQRDAVMTENQYMQRKQRTLEEERALAFLDTLLPEIKALFEHCVEEKKDTIHRVKEVRYRAQIHNIEELMGLKESLRLVNALENKYGLSRT